MTEHKEDGAITVEGLTISEQEPAPTPVLTLEEFKYDYARLWKEDAPVAAITDLTKKYLRNPRLTLWVSYYKDEQDIPSQDFLCRNRMTGTFGQVPGRLRKKIFARAAMWVTEEQKSYSILWLMEDITPLSLSTPSKTPAPSKDKDPEDGEEAEDGADLYNGFTWGQLDMETDTFNYGWHWSTQDEEDKVGVLYRCTYK